MAKLFCFETIFLLISFIISVHNYDVPEYRYRIDGITQPKNIQIRSKRDVESPQTEITIKDEIKSPHKKGVEKFPPVKKPYKKATPTKKKNTKSAVISTEERPVLLGDNETVSTTGNNDGNYSLVTQPPETNVPRDDEAVEDESFNSTGTGYQANLTHTKFHGYYNSHSYSGDIVKNIYWVDMDKIDSTPNNTYNLSLLSDAHRQAFTVALPFEFPFYGNILRNITIATGGFLFTGHLMHTWLAATQYIAPLMANFDTSVSPDSNVRYAQTSTSLTVQWENVRLQDVSNGSSFTFQVTIHESGDIIFAYKDIPLRVDDIQDNNHPVKVGLSDAYIVEKTIFYVRRKTIYEYHKIDMKYPKIISNWTAIVFKAQPTCVSYKDCDTCLNHNTTFQCRWCEQVGRCSDGMDRDRQSWLIKRCDYNSSHHPHLCGTSSTPTPPPPHHQEFVDRASKAPPTSGWSIVVALVVSTSLLLTLLWFAYAYFFPHTPSGQLLIKYRPSRWSWRRGGASYTAANMHSIHM